VFIRLIFIALNLLLASKVLACGCNHPKSFEVAYMPGNAFVGEVISVERVEEDDITTEHVIFKMIEIIKSDEKEFIEVEFFGGWSSCDLHEPNFKVGEVYKLTTRMYFGDRFNPKTKRKIYYSNFCDVRELVNKDKKFAPNKD